MPENTGCVEMMRRTVVISPVRPQVIRPRTLGDIGVMPAYQPLLGC